MHKTYDSTFNGQIQYKHEGIETAGKKHNEKESDSLIKIGSSGSHNVYDAFQAGGETTTWDLEKIMKAMQQIFHDFPARQNKYAEIYESEENPLK